MPRQHVAPILSRAARELGVEPCAAVASFSFDAAVPDSQELLLAPDDLAYVAGRVPLVAANLELPPGITLEPLVVRRVGGIAVGLVGMADTARLEGV